MLRQRLQSSHNLVRAIAHDTVEVRVAAILSTLFVKFENASRISVGRQELAELCGITIETASRVMKEFEKEGLVDLSELGVVTILNFQAIESIAAQR